MLKTVKKIGPVLALFSPEQPEWRMTSIARELGMPKSSTHALLQTLVSIGLLAVNDHGRYQLGSTLLDLSEELSESIPIRRMGLDVLEGLAGELRETVALYVRDGELALCLEIVEGPRPVRLSGFRVGGSGALHSSAVGVVLLSEHTPEQVQRIAMQAAAPPTPSDLHRLVHNVFPTARQNGYACDYGQTVPDVACMAVPVRDRQRSIVAGLTMIAPMYRFQPRRDVLRQAMMDAATTIADGLHAERLRTGPRAEPADSDAVHRERTVVER